MGETFYRNTWVEVDLDAIGYNVRTFRQHLPASTQLMAVVKADGYGHGALAVANEALAAGASCLGVALVDEALELRDAGIKAPILILGYTAPEHVEAAVTQDIAITAFHPDVIIAAETAAVQHGTRATIHIKLDTGMGRVGVTSKAQLQQLMETARACGHVYIEGAFTHFACADEEDPAYTMAQHQHFAEFIEPYSFPIIHCSNSAAGMLFPKWGYNFVRLGISLYGQYPSSYTKNTMELKPAFSLKSKIVHVKKVPDQTAISYGATYRTHGERVIATVPIGYADGFPRSLSNHGEALVHGMRVPIVGRICMDQLMLDISAVADTQIGDEVVLIGKQQEQFIAVDDIAELLGTINYEVTCMISRRVPRVYLRQGKPVMSRNSLL